MLLPNIVNKTSYIVFGYLKITISPSVSRPPASPLGAACGVSPFANAPALPRAPPG